MDLKLDAARAVPLGLILNEMLTNAFKYAYPLQTKGEIRVTLEEAEGGIAMSVADDGVGIDESMDPKTAGSTGMTIMTMLAQQLKGELRIESGKGTKVSLLFKP